MKIDRMLEIIIYLVNHDNVSARYLAERFGVSVRTIHRNTGIRCRGKIRGLFHSADL